MHLFKFTYLYKYLGQILYRLAWGPGLEVTVGSNCLLRSQMGLNFLPLQGARFVELFAWCL